MNVTIRFPKITAKTEAEQINQIKSYLHQLVEQLIWLFNTIEPGSASSTSTNTSTDPDSANELKEYVVKSLNDFVTKRDFSTYQIEISERLPSDYVSHTELGEYEATVTERFAGLAESYVPKQEFSMYKYDIGDWIKTDLPEQYVKRFEYEALQAQVASLEERINAIQGTGGEVNG